MKLLFESAITISKELKKLITPEAINSFGKTMYQGDNANYCISLFQENLIEPNENNKLFLHHLGQILIKWANNKLHKGYFNMADVHHGPELFLGFLPRYISLFPNDESAKNLILNVAEYIGNWRPDSEEWFDYTNNNFKSWYLGSESSNQNKVFKYNTADHLRFVHIALIAWEISGNVKYLKWSLDYSREFAKRILKSKNIVPVAWDADWNEYFAQDMLTSKEKFLAANHHHLNNSKFSGIENLVASGSIYVFGYLYEYSKEEIFFNVSKKIVANLFSILTAPYADTAGIIFNYYRTTFADYSFDKKILQLIKKVSSYNTSELLLAFPEEQKIRIEGIGNRKDMIYWYCLNRLKPKLFQEPPTSFFTLAYNITGEINFVERAFITSARKIKIASSLLRSGYEHADSGKLLSSIISGHGRNWGVGTITGCYSPLIIGSNENLGIHDFLIKFLSPTLSNGCLPIVRKLSNQKIEIVIYNFSNKKNNIEFINKKNNEKISLNIDSNSRIKKILK